MGTSDVGCTIFPIRGAAGVGGWLLTTISFDACEVQPKEFVTVKENVPVGMADIVVLVPVPVVDDGPGIRVTDHVPSAGRPSSKAVPVLTVHVG